MVVVTPMAAKVLVAVGAGDVALAAAAVTELVGDSGQSPTATTLLSVTLAGAVTSLGYVLRAVLKGNLVVSNVAKLAEGQAELDRRLDDHHQLLRELLAEVRSK